MKKMMKRGQVTLFIILAIVIVAGVVLYFVFRNDSASTISVEFQPIYDSYLSCVEQKTRQGIDLMGLQGGYIETPEFVAGSKYMPFSSQLDFLDQPVPYWSYVSGNNFFTEQVPQKADMEQELARFIEEQVARCDFSDFESQGYDVLMDDMKAQVSIKESQVEVELVGSISFVFGEKSATVKNHNVVVESKLGKFYDLAIQVYNHEAESHFLESYALDVMRLYAPVDGVEIGCSPKVFVEEYIRGNISRGLEANFPFIKFAGNYYELGDEKNSYFVEDIGDDVDEMVNIMYSSDWPTRIEIYGDMVAKPVGLQEGLGMLGFCYVPYHFVYDIDFPVLVQFYDGQEMFQFPMAVVIQRNQILNESVAVTGQYIESEVCKYPNQELKVYTYDYELEPVEARLQFKCLDATCEIGETETMGSGAYAEVMAPQCVNGYILASADGYVTARHLISTNTETSADILMKKKFTVGLDLGAEVEKALINFNGEEFSTTVMYPEMKSIELAEDYYNITIYVYQNSSVTIPATSNSECVSVPKSGIEGYLGFEEEKCYDINLPATKLDMAVVGGGNTREYITNDMLKYSNELNIRVPLFGAPTSLEELQTNYALVDEEPLYLEFE